MILLLLLLSFFSLLVSVQCIGDAINIRKRISISCASHCHFFIANKHIHRNANEHICCAHPRGKKLAILNRPLECYDGCRVSLPKQTGLSHQQAVQYSSLRHLIAKELLRSITVVTPTIIVIGKAMEKI